MNKLDGLISEGYSRFSKLDKRYRPPPYHKASNLQKVRGNLSASFHQALPKIERNLVALRHSMEIGMKAGRRAVEKDLQPSLREVKDAEALSAAMRDIDLAVSNAINAIGGLFN